MIIRKSTEVTFDVLFHQIAQECLDSLSQKEEEMSPPEGSRGNNSVYRICDVEPGENALMDHLDRLFREVARNNIHSDESSPIGEVYTEQEGKKNSVGFVRECENQRVIKPEPEFDPTRLQFIGRVSLLP